VNSGPIACDSVVNDGTSDVATSGGGEAGGKLAGPLAILTSCKMGRIALGPSAADASLGVAGPHAWASGGGEAGGSVIGPFANDISPSHDGAKGTGPPAADVTDGVGGP